MSDYEPGCNGELPVTPQPTSKEQFSPLPFTEMVDAMRANAQAAYREDKPYTAAVYLSALAQIERLMGNAERCDSSDDGLHECKECDRKWGALAPLADEDGPGEEDGPWAEGWAQRTAHEPEALPQFVIELPDGDTRTTKVWFTEKRADGKWHVSVTVDGQPPRAAHLETYNDQMRSGLVRLLEWAAAGSTPEKIIKDALFPPSSDNFVLQSTPPPSTAPFKSCCFDGPPPEPFDSWSAWASERPFRGVTIRATATKGALQERCPHYWCAASVCPACGAVDHSARNEEE